MSTIITRISVSLATLALLAHTQPSEAQTLAPVARPGSPMTSPVQGGFDAAIYALHHNQWAEAVRLYTPLVNAANAEQRGQARFGLAIAFSQLGEDQKALEVLDGSLRDETPLGKAIGDLRGELLLQLADKHLAQQGFASTNPWLAQYERLQDQPNRNRYLRIRAASDRIGDGTTPTGVLRVGVMLPLSGQLGEVGNSVLHGIQLGIKEFDGRRGTRVELLVTDVTDAKQADTAAATLLEQQVDVVIGPLLAPAVTEAGGSLGPSKVPVLALSNDRSVTGNGVYTLNYLPGEQAKLMARTAISAGKQRLAVLAPNTAYGTEAAEAFANEVKRLNATLTGSSFYDPKATDIGPSIRNVVGTQAGSVAFDSLLVPAPTNTMALIKAQLSYYDVDKNDTLLLGTGLWQNNELLKTGVNMQGGVFAAPPKAFVFEQNYESAFGGKANALAVVGYDTARILTDVAAEKLRTGQDVQSLLLRPEGFYGSGGYFKFSPDGRSARGLDVVKVGPRQFEVLAPALTQPPLPVPQNLQPAGNAGRWFAR
ncbi:MAG: penicillin-binding protein activator [Alphaproteobacteria bacterium]|nr:MAG: penicillin-binding protein activator [Alphaproteobacteria bacterium]